jgi:CPA1 family monovalent cation:H+ antiporter
MSLIDVIASVLIFAVTGILGLLIARFIRLPFALTLVILGFFTSFLIEPLGWDTGIRAHNFEDLMLFVLLPVLIFEAAFSMDERLLFKFSPSILTLASVGLLVSTSIIAAILFVSINHPGFPLIAAILAGVVISATDPAAVITQLKVLKAPKELSALIEGESLFNDATAIVLFGIVLSAALGAQESSVIQGISTFFIVFFGGIIVGSVLGTVAAYVCRIVEVNVQHIAFVTLTLAYGSFYISEHIFDVSGVVAVLFAALAFKKFACKQVAQIEKRLNEWWQSISLIANVFVFVLLGLVITLEMFEYMYLAIAYGIVAATIARILAVYSSVGISHFLWRQPIDKKYPPVIIWGGVRGAVTIALVLSLPTELSYWWTIQSIGFGVVLFTLIVQATTTPWLIKSLKL